MKSIVNYNRIYADGIQIREFFNKYFSSVSSKIHESIPSPTSEDDFSCYLRNIQMSTTSSFSTIQITDVVSTIISLNENKTVISTYPNRILTCISNLVSPSLIYIMNKSLTAGCFPKLLKTARVVPIIKTGDRSVLTNYRPISFLPVFRKVFEKIVHKQVQSFLDFFNVFDSPQFGFRPRFSTSQPVYHSAVCL